MVMSLNKAAEASITINEEQGPVFKLQRSVHQGCPLAPYLFLFAADVLGYMMDNKTYGTEGLQLPDTSSLTNLMFTDDTSLFLRSELANFQRAMKVLELFCEASGAKVNWHKTVAIWASRRDRIWDWGGQSRA
jgi:hypothetical protein